MIDKKLADMKKMMEDLDKFKLKYTDQIDSIWLISENLSRTNQSSNKKGQQKTQQKNPVSVKKNTTPQLKTAFHKTYSLQTPVFQKSSKLLLSQVNGDNKKRMSELASKLYQARNQENQSKYSEAGFAASLKTFLMKNERHGIFNSDRVDLSGLAITHFCWKAIFSMMAQFETINLSRNILRCVTLETFNNLPSLKVLILKNCNMKNEELCCLFNILVETRVEKLSICSPDIKDRNQLTKYDELYNLLEKSETLTILEMVNIQISPKSELFNYAKKSKSLKVLNVEKNTGVAGMCKNLTKLNLSWNGIKKPDFLKCLECSMEELDLTGNKIPSYSFEDQISISNYPKMISLTLDHMMIDHEALWLQQYLETTRTLKNLSLVECGLTKSTLFNVIHGLDKNKSLKVLNLSGNKIPIFVAESFVVSIRNSVVSDLCIEQCDITDECGQIIFGFIKNNHSIYHINARKNMLSQKTSETICRNLKTNCYNLLRLETEQNFIKYGQLQEIDGYIMRNQHMAMMKVIEEHRKFKALNSNNNQITKNLEEVDHTVEELTKETEDLSHACVVKFHESRMAEAKILEEAIKKLRKQEKVIKKKISILREDEYEEQLSNPEDS